MMGNYSRSSTMYLLSRAKLIFCMIYLEKKTVEILMTAKMDTRTDL